MGAESASPLNGGWNGTDRIGGMVGTSMITSGCEMNLVTAAGNPMGHKSWSCVGQNKGRKEGAGIPTYSSNRLCVGKGKQLNPQTSCDSAEQHIARILSGLFRSARQKVLRRAQLDSCSVFLKILYLIPACSQVSRRASLSWVGLFRSAKQKMPRRPFSNLTIIDNTDLTDLDTNSFANAIMVAAPDTASLPCNAYELRDAIYQHHGITIALESISYYGPGFFLRLPTPAAKTHLLTNCFISINNNNFVFMPWKQQHGATSVPLQDLLRSNPLNLHLAKDTPTNEPYERLIIYISGMPPHLCSNSVLY
ncbi:unnamed protein product [Miscanthus lutarioriparius]|uniref:Uncharacterized protein n=1 Tax=Miscanthus lutarioriparius TaxID=422564 RepID=A0A811MIW8_9POAL|nr:unnamed protein product [Miscanthus lutarioriparius]